MSDFEKKTIDEMDAAEMLQRHREEHPVEDQVEDREEHPVEDQVEDREEHPVEDQVEDRDDGHWAWELRAKFEGSDKRRNRRQGWELRAKFEGSDKRRNRRQGWEAFSLACYHGLVVLACAGALVGGPWGLILVGIGISNLIMVGGWLHKAKAGWSV